MLPNIMRPFCLRGGRDFSSLTTSRERTCQRSRSDTTAAPPACLQTDSTQSRRRRRRGGDSRVLTLISAKRSQHLSDSAASGERFHRHGEFHLVDAPQYIQVAYRWHRVLRLVRFGGFLVSSKCSLFSISSSLRNRSHCSAAAQNAEMHRPTWPTFTLN